MKAVRVHEFGLSHPMRVDEVEDPVPLPGELLIKAAAAGVNPVDIIIRIGKSPRARGTKVPYIPGHNTAGEVAAIGEGVEGFKVGQRVFGLAFGCYASLVRIEAERAGILPDSYTFEEGAGITSPFFTAWNALVFKAGASAGETVLVHGGAGGVGMASIQLAKRMGCRVFTTVSSKEKADFCRGIGADETINYREEDFAERCQALTGGRGVDVIVEISAVDNLDKDMEAICVNGRIAVIGMGIEKGPQTELRVPALMGKDARVFGLTFANLLPKIPELIRRFTPLLREGKLEVNIDRTFSLEEANEAQELVRSGKVPGKVVLTL
ncbi:zinc-binding alcohol dehydrogenase family protein [Nitrospinota bacterium]